MITDLCRTRSYGDERNAKLMKFSSIDAMRIVCCTPIDVRHLYHVLFEDGKILGLNSGSKGKISKVTLPPVTSVKRQRRDNFNLPIDSKNTDYASNQSICKTFFDGTLHVIGASTIHNVYHAGNAIKIRHKIFISDNLQFQWVIIYFRFWLK